MSLSSVEALLRRNAEACEQAKYPKCVCHCGGALHGRRHASAWIAEIAQRLYADQCALQELERIAELERAGQSDLFAGVSSHDASRS